MARGKERKRKEVGVYSNYKLNYERLGESVKREGGSNCLVNTAKEKGRKGGRGVTGKRSYSHWSVRRERGYE